MKTSPLLLVILGVQIALSAGAGIGERIVNGNLAKEGQFPFMVSLRGIKNGSGNIVFCGGVLVSEDVVLTAAHCIQELTSLTVRFGLLDLENPTIVQDVPLSNIHSNDFNRATAQKDIAIIQLENKVEVTDNVAPVSLPRKAWSDPNTFVNHRVVTAGWGKTSDQETQPSRYLRYAKLYIADYRMCNYIDGQTGDGYVCTDKRLGQATCEGDSGGPIIIEIKGTRYVLGVDSHKYGACASGEPEYFTNIAQYLDWIHNITGVAVQ